MCQPQNQLEVLAGQRLQRLQLLRSLLRRLLRRRHEQAQGGANAIAVGTGTTYTLQRLPTPEIHRHKMILSQNTVYIDIRTFATVFVASVAIYPRAHCGTLVLDDD